MNGAIYVLSRNVSGDDGVSMMQNVTVFAESPAQAKALVDAQFAQLRRASRSAERAYQPTPDWNVEKIALDAHKLITAGLTS
jgi:hypothetical protein